MAGEGFTVLHASDFQLDVPLGGFRWIPEAIEQQVLAAPETAARRVFDLAIKHQVDMLALTGNLLCPAKSSARSLSFLLDQFSRMHEHGIPVAWATGASDPLDAWPTSMIWPDSSMRFDRGMIDRRVLTLGGMDIEVLGCGGDAAGHIHPQWFDGLSRGDRQLVIGGGTVDAFKQLEAAELWLLGGRSYAERLVDGNANVFYAGVPQGRCLADSGPRGAQLIFVNEQVERTELDCAAIRYENVNIHVESVSDLDDLELKLCEYVESNSWKDDRISLIQWDIDCKQFSNAFHSTNREFVQWQQQITQNSMLSTCGVFTLGVNVHCGKNSVDVSNGEGLLGDYSFALDSLRENGWSDIQLGGAQELDGVPSDWTRVEENLEGLRTLDDAARLGELLLGGHVNTPQDLLSDTNTESEAA